MNIKFTIKSGEMKKHKIIYNNLHKTKPTKDIIKRQIISYINNFKEKNTLDLFSGTASICFELYSINAKKIILIDIDKKIIKDINYNKNTLIKKKDFIVYENNSYNWLKKLNFLNVSFILFDPPYAFKDYKKYFINIDKIKFLKKSITLIVETNNNLILNILPLNFFIIKKEKIGKTKIHIIKKI